ncbi:MAG: hypothetical protein WC121_06785 [Candidatus Kapaibacterium sp.]
MSIKKLKNKLKNDQRFFPYNQNYDFKYIKEYLETNNLLESNSQISQNVLCSIYFNKYFKYFKELYFHTFEVNQTPTDEFFKILITLLNREVYIMGKKMMDSMENLDEFHFDELINSKIDSIIPEYGFINVQGGLEASHEALNTIINLHQLNRLISSNPKIDLSSVKNSSKLLTYSNIYTSVKFAYDMTVWGNYSVSIDDTKELIKISCTNTQQEKIIKIGQRRFISNMHFSIAVMISDIKKENKVYKFLLSESNKRRKQKRLKSVKVIDGEIYFNIAKGNDKEEAKKELLTMSAVLSHYPFLTKERLLNFGELNIQEVLSIFIVIQNLFEQVSQISKEETNIIDLEYFNLFTLKVKQNVLIEYVLTKTNFSKSQIKKVIEAFVYSQGYINIWEKPLIEINNYLYPVLLPLLQPNLLRITDYLLDTGGFDLKKRGKLFENYLKFELINSLREKDYQINIIKNNIFKNSKKDYEEIDLIAELKGVTIIAEIKCIKFPFEPRDYNSMLKRLTEGTEQINRKVEFLNKFKNEIKGLSFLNKPIVKLVITNYPHFSGLVINDVPITDATLIDNYFINGAFTSGHIVSNKDVYDIYEASSSSIIYYNNEDDLSKNLKSFFHNPIPIAEQLKDVYLKETLISLPTANPKIVMDFFDFKQSHYI